MESRNSLVRARNDRQQLRAERQELEQSSKSRDLKDGLKQPLALTTEPDSWMRH
jgi:hypothetical protein